MRLSHAALVLLALFALPPGVGAQDLAKAPTVILTGIPFQISVKAGLTPVRFTVRDAAGTLLGSGAAEPLGTGVADGLVVQHRAQLPLEVQVEGGPTHSVMPTMTPGWFSLVPPLIAIALALIFREVVTALFAGVWLGALAVAGFNPITGTWRVIDTFVVPALGDTQGGHTQVVVFSLLLGGMVGIIARNGGTLGIVEAVAPFARTARRGKFVTWLAGMAIFFDDYANTLIVGNTMRPITDRLKISREKLAYLVDSTAAPVAAIIPISTWVGYEISLIADGLRIAAEQSPEHAAMLAGSSPFAIFIETIPYRFYPLLALYFAFLVAVMDRDLGPMAAAERRAQAGGGLFRPGAQLATDTTLHIMDPKEGTRCRWWNAGAPVLTVILVVLAGLYTTGRAGAGPDAGLRDVFGAADPFVTLLWGSLAGCLMAIGLSLVQRILTVAECIDAWLGGMRAMIIAMIILVLAWSLGAVTQEIGTSQYLSQILSDHVSLHFLPVLVFMVSAAMSFATGTSWGTMAILLPLVIPLTVALGGDADFSGGAHYTVLLGVISSVLAGSIFGDHCSPISDTTVLSSTASGCDHVDHVRTQLPYALLVAVVGMIVGDIPTAFGFPVWGSLGLGVVALYLIMRIFGKTTVENRPA